jgi:excisionase family DNA binding protein
MSRYLIRRIEYQDHEFKPEELMTFAEAAKYLGVPLTTVISNADAGRLTVVIDKKATHQGRRLVLRQEIEIWKKSKASKS